MTNLTRRSLITGLISLVAAPAIVRAGSLMPVKVMATDAECQAVVNAMVSYWMDQNGFWMMEPNGMHRISYCEAEDRILIRSDPHFGVDNSK